MGLDLVKRLLEHRFLAAMLRGRDLVRVVDTCSGTGIGGYLFAKLLLEIERGYSIELTLVDVRLKALQRGLGG